MPDFEIVAVSDRTRTWGDPPNGPFVSYRVDLKGTDGQTVQGAEWSRKQSSPPPTVGQQVSGTLDLEAKFGPKFKQQAAFQGRGGGGPRPEDPKKAAHIARMHAQGVAVEHARVLATIGRLPDDFNLAQLKQIIEWFEKDAKEARDRA
jgi:hypothetical protein